MNFLHLTLQLTELANGGKIQPHTDEGKTNKKSKLNINDTSAKGIINRLSLKNFSMICR